MGTFAYPNNMELLTIGPEFVGQQLAGDPLLNAIMPIVEVNAAVVAWEQKDSYFGLQQLRGLDGQPNYVARTGSNRYAIEPGVYGEFVKIDETELTRRSMPNSNMAVDISDLIIEAQQQLIQRELDRVRYIGWTLLATGTFAVAIPNTGTAATGVAHKDTFTLQTQNRAVDWDTVATATPLADFRAVQAKGAEKGVNFGAGKAYMNTVTANKLLSITNSADIGGRRTVGGGTINSVAEVNRILLGEGLPEIVVYDGGYQSAASTFTRWIANDKVICIGARPSGETIMQYKMTRNVNAPSMVGSYDFVKDYFSGLNAPKEVPGRIEVHRGHNGGPAIFYPGSVCVLSV